VADLNIRSESPATEASSCHGRPGSTPPFNSSRLNPELKRYQVCCASLITQLPKEVSCPIAHILILILARGRLGEHARAASLDGLHLSLGPGETTETRGELSAVEELAVLGLDWAKRRARVAANGAVEGSAAERTVLLSLRAVGSEGVRESSSGRGGVSARSVVNRLRDGTLSDETNERGAGSRAESGSDTHCEGWLLRWCRWEG
jgi:hypothetical protein